MPKEKLHIKWDKMHNNLTDIKKNVHGMKLGNYIRCGGGDIAIVFVFCSQNYQSKYTNI